MIAYAKANPGKINFASPGSGSQNRLEMELVRKAEGLDMVHVPYKGGAGPAVIGPHRRRDAHDVHHRVLGARRISRAGG